MTRRDVLRLLAIIVTMLTALAGALEADEAMGVPLLSTTPAPTAAIGVQVKTPAGTWRFVKPAAPYRNCMQPWKALELKVKLRQRGKVSRVRVCPNRYPHLRGDLDADRDLLAALEGVGTRLDRYLYVNQGRRTRAEQQALYDEGLRRHGACCVRKWVALPGTSRHETGRAADVVEYGRPWVNLRTIMGADDACARERCHWPMSWEPWHVEMLGSR
jgi:D-alanyl-D-alanine carboxypeptidase